MNERNNFRRFHERRGILKSNMKKLFLSMIFLFQSYGFAGSDVCTEWNALSQDITENRIEKGRAKSEIMDLHQRLLEEYSAKIVDNDIFFPVKGYSLRDIGGNKGSGFEPRGYNFYDGNKHKAHPAHDIFINDLDEDSKDDATSLPVPVLSFSAGVVVAAHAAWNPESGLRGGKYIAIFSPHEEKYYFYAHLSEVFVNPGDIVRGGQAIGSVGRTGKNADKSRSPTHLHFMALSFDNGKMAPYDTYTDLVESTRAKTKRSKY